MLKAAVLILAVALLCSNADASSFYAKCNTFTDCEAKASVNIKLVGPGKCTATSKAFCKAKAKSISCFNKETLYIDLDKCRKVDVAIDAKCWAAAAAKAIAAASVETECIGGKKGYTFACGKAEANAVAFACGLAKAIVDLKVSLGDDDNAICEAEVVSAIDAIAKAVASASAASCVGSNESGIDSEAALAKAIEKVVAKAFGSCFVYCKDTVKKDKAKAIADGAAVADVVKSEEVEIEKGGEAIAKTGHK